MGIKNLFRFLQENAPKAIREQKVESYTGQVLAIDASTCLYQHVNLTNDAGEVTSHLNGFLARTVRLLEAGVKPVYVFDGKPPEFKAAELEERRAKRKVAEEELKAAIEAGDNEAIRKASHRTVRATPKMNDDVKRLLQLMGCPIIEAPSEAEASCAALAKSGIAYAAVTEDMDVLTFGSPVMVKNLFGTQSSRTASGPAAAKVKPVYEVNLKTALEQLDVNQDQFIDFCILSGCDYLETIPKVGPAMGFKLVKEHGGMEALLGKIDQTKYPVPKEFENVAEVQRLFREPEVVDTASVKLQWGDPDVAALKAMLIDENQFAPERIERMLERLQAARSKKTQMRLDSFFKAKPTTIKAEDKFDPFKKKPATKRPSVGGAGGTKKAKTEK